jgi:hypothetical protein
MASGWTIYSFSRSHWDAVFASKSADAAQHIVDAVFWDEPGYFADDGFNPGKRREAILASKTGDKMLELAGQLAWYGFNYADLDPASALLLDQLGSHMWSPESLGGHLDAQVHSPDFVPVRAIEELLYRSGNVKKMPKPNALFRQKAGWMTKPVPHMPAKLLPYMLNGRRFGTDTAPLDEHSVYAIFSPGEVAELFFEIRAAVQTAEPWRDPQNDPGSITACLLNPVSDVADRNRWLAISYVW